MSHRTVTICRDAEELAARAAERLIVAAGGAVGQRGRFTVALAVGSTPERMYPSSGR